jgi:paraquat-inducible protein B
MPLDLAHLSSLSTGLDELTERVTALADELSGSPREDVAADLYEVERNLQAATRRLRTLLDKVDRSA